MQKQENAIVGIYKITSPSGKVYIGQSINIGNRKYNYKQKNCKTQIKLYYSLEKYSFKNHTFEIIEVCNFTSLNEREVYHKQQELDRVGGDWSKVLFCELYDRGGGPRSDEVKQKISKTNKGRPFSEQQKINHKNSLEKRWKNKDKSDKGKSKHSPKGKQSIREKLWKPIIQYDLQGNFIKEWPSTNHAAEYYGVTSSAITRNIHNLSKSSCNFKWALK